MPQLSTFETVKFNVHGGIGTVTLHRPDTLNAIDRAMRQELLEIAEYAHESPELQALIVTGEGKAFSSGGDIKLFEKSFEETVTFRNEVAAYTRIFDLFETMEKPVIAAINGFCTGAGLQLTLSCDLRIAGESASFAFLENNIGLLPAAGGCSRLVKLIGLAKAKELVLLGEKIPAQEAWRINLVNQVVPDSKLLEKATEIARSLLLKAPEALGLVKRILMSCADLDLTAGRYLEALGQSILVKTKDHKEGIQAFREKRKPNFKKEN